MPIFQPGRIVLQQVRQLSPSFNAALLGFVEAHREDDADKNRLCPPNPYPRSIEDWPRMVSRTWTDGAALVERARRLERGSPQSRLNLLRALPEHVAEPSVQTALERYLTHVGAAIERLQQLDGSDRVASRLTSSGGECERRCAAGGVDESRDQRCLLRAVGEHLRMPLHAEAEPPSRVHTASTVESAATAHTRRPAPTLSTAWWW